MAAIYLLTNFVHFFFLESDSESVPSVSPLKRFRNAPKTLEQIRLEKIQAESAAFYNYESQQFVGRESTLSNRLDVDCRQKLKESRQVALEEDLREKMLSRKAQQQQQGQKEEAETTTNIENIKVLSLEEIREKRRRKQEEEEMEREMNPQIRIPKQKITFTAEEEEEDVEVEVRVSPVKRKIEAVQEEEEEEEVVVEVEKEKSKKKRRAHSPVVFDLSHKLLKKEKKNKEEKKKKKHKKEKKEPKVSLDATKFENFQVTANLSSPSKPTVVVVARKRAVVEEPAVVEPCKKIKKEKSEKRPERPLWRPSRLAKPEDPIVSEAKASIGKHAESKAPLPRVVIRQKVPIQPPPPAEEPARLPKSDPFEDSASVQLTRKIKLKRPAAPADPSPPKREEEEFVVPAKEPSTSKLSLEIPKTPPPLLSQSISIDDEFDLLSPCSDPDNSFVKTTDEKIFEDIDALLNE